MFLELISKKDVFKLVDLTIYMVTNHELGISDLEKKVIDKLIPCHLEAKDEYSWDNPKKVDLESTINYFKDKSPVVKNVVLLNLLRVSMADDFYSTDEHFFIDDILTSFGYTAQQRRKLLEIVYLERDMLEKAKRYIKTIA